MYSHRQLNVPANFLHIFSKQGQTASVFKVHKDNSPDLPKNAFLDKF